MEAWTDLYKEVAEKVTSEIPEIKWVDLWHEQISYLSEELPFPAPAVFIAFKTLSCDDRSLLVQDCDTQIDLYLFFESFSDTYKGSYNQENAIEFLHLLTKLHTTFHGVSGSNFNTMRRVGMEREESGESGNLYRISFSCIVEDASAKAEYDQQVVTEIDINNTPIERPFIVDNEPLFQFQ